MEQEIQKEIERLKEKFQNADDYKIEALQALLYQAAFETVMLRKLDERAMESGYVKFHPNNPAMQKTLPISNEISKHSAALTNIMDKLMKHLATETDDEDDGLSDYA